MVDLEISSSSEAVTAADTGDTIERFEISRDEASGGGFQVATLAPRSSEERQERPSVVIGSVAAGGPAAIAGMLEEHIGWHIIQVNGKNVDSETVFGALDATRTPGQSFTLTIRKPRTGDMTIDSTLTARRYVDPQDIADIQFTGEMVERGPDGQLHVRMNMPSRLSGILSSEDAEQLLYEMLRNLGLLRVRLDPAEIAALEEEELRASEKDVEVEEVSQRCVVCFTKQRAILFLPCRHFATCYRCTVLVRRMGKCPLCRQQIDDVKDAGELGPEDSAYVS